MSGLRERLERLKRQVASAFAGTGSRKDGKRPQHPKTALREVILLAWPIATGLLGDAGMGLVDAKLVGALGASALGGVGLGLTFMYLCYSSMFGLMRGVKVRTAYAVGRGTPEDGARYAVAGVILGALMGVVVWAVGRDVGWALDLLRVGPEMRAPARAFFSAVSWGAPSVFVMSALVQHRQGLGDARTPMIVGIAGNVLNAFLAFGLIHGRFGLPALGVRGAGFATAITQTAQATTLLILLARAKYAQASALTLPRATREVCSLGVPTGLHFAAEMTAFTTFTAILGSIGQVEIAAHQVALAVIRASFLPGIAVAEAASVLVGQSLGRRDLGAADKAARASLQVAITFMALCGVVFAVLGTQIARAFTPDPAVARVATHLLWLAALFQVLDAVNIVFRGALRGAKDVRVIAILGISIIWSCVPTAAFFLGKLAGWGAVGGWCGFLAETILASILFYWRWKRGAWRRDYPAEAPTGADAASPTELAAA